MNRHRLIVTPRQEDPSMHTSRRPSPVPPRRNRWRGVTALKLAGLGLAAGLVAAAPAVAAGPELKTEEQKTLYALGLAIARNLGTFGLSEAELELVKAGLTDGVLQKEPRVDLPAYAPKIQALQQTRGVAQAAGEKKAGQAYLAKAAAEKGAVKTASGLIMIAMKPGTGPSPKPSDTVKVHYHGTLIDGSVFDSSVQRGEPATFPLNGVVPCWTEGLQLMKVGGKSRLVCPSELAYQDRGAPPRIKPGATLVFEVELLEIVKP
jgi:FKBP-type peptidyl-prolyl cis-trans isomerase FkpA/FKBP-type peptidyl-prolyl cis-trans isomerase FklB